MSRRQLLIDRYCSETFRVTNCSLSIVVRLHHSNPTGPTFYLSPTEETRVTYSDPVRDK